MNLPILPILLNHNIIYREYTLKSLGELKCTYLNLCQGWCIFLLILCYLFVSTVPPPDGTTMASRCVTPVACTTSCTGWTDPWPWGRTAYRPGRGSQRANRRDRKKRSKQKVRGIFMDQRLSKVKFNRSITAIAVSVNHACFGFDTTGCLFGFQHAHSHTTLCSTIALGTSLDVFVLLLRIAFH